MNTLLLIGYIFSAVIGFRIGFKFVWEDWTISEHHKADTEIFVISFLMGVLFGMCGPVVCGAALIKAVVEVIAKKDRLIKLGHKIAGTK
jgi:uncharacterized membrane protein SpoIIM required for sporulation